MTTGQRIQKARKEAKLSQKELGEKLGVSASMIGQYENDLRNPKNETLNRIAEALGVHPKELRNDHMFWFEDFASLGDGQTAEKECELLSAFSKLNEDGQQKAVERVEELTAIQKYQARRMEFNQVFSSLQIKKETLDRFVSALAALPDEGLPLIAAHIESIAADPEGYLKKAEETRHDDALNMAAQMISIIEENKKAAPDEDPKP